MSYPIPRDVRKTGFFFSTALTQVLRQLRDLADEMASEGFQEDAATVTTSIGDLEWVYESVLDKELGAQWPRGPRRPLRVVGQR